MYARAQFKRSKAKAAGRASGLLSSAVILLGVACGVATPIRALTVDEARHLLTRTGFGASPDEIRAVLPLTRAEAVDRIVGGLSMPEPDPAPPEFVLQPVHDDYVHRLGEDYAPAAMMGAVKIVGDDAEADKALDYKGMQEMAQLRAWWLDRMISTRTPFYERLALFWHGHFTSRYFEVLGPRLMYDQLQTIRHEGARNFGVLLNGMLRDPAMLIFLDNAINTKGKPNENLAREAMELFTLGVGNYSEDDVKALARILSGNSVDFAGDWRYLDRKDQRDLGEKRFLGHQGRWTVEDAERFLLQKPQTASLIARKFYLQFVSSDPDPTEIERLAAIMRHNHYDMPPFLRAMLMSQAFWAPANRGQLVKSPVELEVGFIRTFGYAMPDVSRIVDMVKMLGEELFEPPSVQGWKVGMQWLNLVNERSEEVGGLWQCRGAVSRWLESGPRDLMIRYSAEREGNAPVELAVKIDGQEVVRGQANCPLNLIRAGVGAKPTWDLLVVPRDRLPKEIHTIEVAFVRPQGQNANLFVNWVAVDGKRYPAFEADHQVFDASSACTPVPVNVPKGMLYCQGRTTFDLAAVAARLGREDASLYDRREGPVNSVLESATTRLPLTLRPPRVAVGSDDEARWRGLPLQEAILATPPILSQSGTGGISERIGALITDPAYNLE